MHKHPSQSLLELALLICVALVDVKILADNLWDLWKECWNKILSLRPAAEDVLDQMANIMAFVSMAPVQSMGARWVSHTLASKRTSTQAVQPLEKDDPEVIYRKVNSLLNRLTVQKFVKCIASRVIKWRKYMD
jgi:hypothetical protein